MKNISTGAGLAIVGLGIALHPVLSGFASSASASASSAPIAVSLTSVALAQAVPTVVWMGVTSEYAYGSGWTYHRLWSDGRMESRFVRLGYTSSQTCGGGMPAPGVCGSDWIEVPPPTGGNGFACRADMNGDRLVDGADLGIMLNAWGQQGGCEPDATYPCLDLGNLAGAVAAK